VLSGTVLPSKNVTTDMTQPFRSLRRGRVAFALVVAATVVAASCGSDDTAVTEPSADPVLAIDGATFLSESVTGRDLVADSVLNLSFDNGLVGGDAGCNQIGGAEYDIVAGALVLTSPLAMTEMACMEPPGLMEQEQWYVEFLGSRPSISKDGDRLTLDADGVTVVFLDRRVADPDLPLEGTAWQVTSAIEGDAVSSVPSGGSLEFDDGTVVVRTGCNNGTGSYELSDDGESVTFGPVALTKMACVDEEASRLESTMLATLSGTVDVEIVASSLTLSGGDVGLGLNASTDG
jgi:heat shock protein HslJ